MRTNAKRATTVIALATMLHSIAIGTIGGVADVSSVGGIWVDAHGEFNTPETAK